MNWKSKDEVLRFAIRKEADAAAYYRMLSERSVPGVKKAFEELAKEEEKHKEKLESIDFKKIDKMELKEPKGLGLAELMEDVTVGPDMSYADLLRMAIKNEERSQRFYASTAEMVEDDPPLKKLLLILAQEESVHKEKLEKLYDKDVMEWF